MALRTMQLLFFICLIVFAADARADCDRPALAHQRRDAATIQRLETAWTLAYLGGDAEFESCLLTSDFTEIMSNGSINHLSEELGLAVGEVDTELLHDLNDLRMDVLGGCCASRQRPVSSSDGALEQG